MRDFRRKRAELQEQLESLQEALEDTNFQHKQQMTALEEKFFEEKVYNNEACSHKKIFLVITVATTKRSKPTYRRTCFKGSL